MQIIHNGAFDKKADRVYVSIRESESGEVAATNQFRKFGVILYWDGRGEMLGIEFVDDAVNGDVIVMEMDNVSPVRTS
jgi:uncharacterized protein YuzE